MFAISEFVVEQLLRNQLETIKTSDIESLDFVMEDIFGKLYDDLLKDKYGRAEIDKLKTVIQNSQIKIFHALPESSDTELPSFSIHLQTDTEQEHLAGFTNFDGLEEQEVEIEPSIIVDTFTATNYDFNTGKIDVLDSANLASLKFNNWLIDSDGNEFQVTSPISNETGNKYFYINNGPESLILANLKVVSAIDVRKFIERMIPCREMIMIGIHSQSSLLTKFLYHILKYIMYKNADNLIQYNLQLAKYSGSDFNQAQTLLPENIYSRFLTMEFISYNSYKHQEVTLYDSVESTVYVEKDEIEREDNENQSVKTTE